MRCLPFAILVFCAGAVCFGEAPRVLPDGQVPQDERLGTLKTLNGHFPFVVPDNPAAWYSRADSLRRRVAVANGLWPMPDKTPLQPVVFGRVARDGFTVERVHFQSLPGHYVTGLLFRPTDPSSQRSPGVLSPHGHGGRMQRHSDAEIAKQIAQGAEHFESSGSMPKLARCAQLARMGCVTFIFDMLGYADSIQIPREVAHRHANSRPEETQPTDRGWVFYSPEADLRLQSIMGLQTWNAIRALDFLESLPDVDPERLAVTGGSGGGTQSILLGALDNRIKVSFPNGMVSTAMQGGCYCENCNLLRVETGNVELAALFAPRPQAMTAADDWTKAMMSDGYPELKWLYAMIGDESDVYCRPMLHFKHNYNYVTRATMYQWMNRHLGLGLDDPVVERDFELLSDDESTVWSDGNPLPGVVGVEHERDVCRWLDQQATAKLDALLPTDADSLAQYRKVVGGAWEVIFDQGPPDAKDLKWESKGTSDSDSLSIERGLLRDATRGSELPMLVVRPQGAAASNDWVVWTERGGKEAAFDDSGQPTALLTQLTRRGATVLLPDLLGQGEFNSDRKPLEVQRLIDDERNYSAFTFGYNRTLVAQRCADLLCVIAYASGKEGSRVSIYAGRGAATWAAPAAAVAGDRAGRVLIDSGGERFASVRSYRDANFVPGAVKYGDVPALMALRAPNPLRVVGEKGLPRVVTAAYSAAGAKDAVSLENKSPEADAVADWLLE